MQIYDLIIIGGGASGLFLAATTTAKKVLLLEGSSRVGKKILITGAGMCNLTNVDTNATLLTHYGGSYQANFLKPAFLNFPTSKTRSWFESHGLPLIVREDGKVFPSSLDANSVVSTLYNQAQRQGVTFEVNAKVLSIIKDDIFKVETKDKQYRAKKVALCTGGMSYALTGSDGSGYALAKMLGHTIVPPAPALVAVTVVNYPWRVLAGNAIRGSLVDLFHHGENKRYAQVQGDLLFTHDGLSGPVILNSSRSIHKGDLLTVSLLKTNNRELLREYLHQVLNSNPKKQVSTLLKQEGLITHLTELVLEQAGITSTTTCANLPKTAKKTLLELLTAYPFTIAGKKGFHAAMVTAGGVTLSEVDRRNMGSKLCEGLFFCGEVLDIDGDTGGYNLQAAFATAQLAKDAIVP